MDTQTVRATNSDIQQEARSGTSSAELAAVVAVLTFVAVAAASILIATPQTFQAAASAQPVVQQSTVTELPERPFHERYPIRPSGDAVDTPTF